MHFYINFCHLFKNSIHLAVDLKTGEGSIYRGPPKSGKADVTLTMDDEDVILMMLGKLNPQRVNINFYFYF